MIRFEFKSALIPLRGGIDELHKKPTLMQKTLSFCVYRQDQGNPFQTEDHGSMKISMCPYICFLDLANSPKADAKLAVLHAPTNQGSTGPPWPAVTIGSNTLT